MSTAAVIHWIDRSPYLHEARVTVTDGADLYAGYVAVTPGAAVWRGYVGRGFVLLGVGPRMEMQRLVEQRVAEIMQRDDLGLRAL
jgi:hypothetical protein